MGGYDRTEHLTVWRLTGFDGHPDLWVRVTVPTIEAEVLARELAPLFLSGRRAEMAAAVARLAGPFADSLLGWSVEWAGRPVKPTRRGLLRIDLELAADILREWTGSPAWDVARGQAGAGAPARGPAGAQEPADDLSVEERESLAALPMLALVPDDPPEVVDVEPVGEVV